MRHISSLALAFGFLGLAGCPGDDSSTDSTTVAATSTTNATTDSGEDTVTPVTTTESETEATTVSDSSGGGGGGFCGQTCEAAADCGDETMFACTDGFCEYTGEIPACDPTTCDDLMIGVCADVNGNSVCTTPCDDDSMCVAGFTECTGEDDAGNSICAGIPCGGVAEGELCDIPMFGAIGTCTDGVCTCTDDSECTAPDFACNN